MKRVLRWSVAALVLLWFWHRVDWASIRTTVVHAETNWLVLGLALFLPQFLVSAVRWRVLVETDHPESFYSSLMTVMATNALNLYLPGKMGDLFFKGTLAGIRPLPLRFGLPVLERLLDVAFLFLLMACAVPWVLWESAVLSVVCLVLATLLVYWIGRGIEGIAYGDGLPRSLFSLEFILTAVSDRWPALIIWTGILWLLHIAQVWCFFRSAGVPLEPVQALAGVPALFLAAVVPLAPWGLGSREVVLVVLFGSVASPAQLGMVAVLFLLRYLVPGALGVPALMALDRIHCERVEQGVATTNS